MFSPDAGWTIEQQLSAPVTGLVGTEHVLALIGDNELVHLYDSRAKKWLSAPSLPAPAAAPGAAIVGDRVYVLGDLMVSLPASALLAPPGSWRYGPPLPEPRAEAAVARQADRIVFAGGFDPEEVARAGAWMLSREGVAGADVWNPGDEPTWVGIDPLPSATARAGSTTMGGTIRMLGGGAGEPAISKTHWTHDGEGWTAHLSLPEDVGDPGVAALQDTLYAIAGDALQNALDGVSKWTPGQGAWDTLTAAYPVGGPLPNVVAFGNTLWAVAGFGLTSVYALGEGEWQAVFPLPSTPLLSTAVATPTHIAVIGGSLAGVPSNAVNLLDPTTGGWVTAPSLNTKRAAADAVVNNGELYVVGGRTPDVDDVVEIIALEALTCPVEPLSLQSLELEVKTHCVNVSNEAVVAAVAPGAPVHLQVSGTLLTGGGRQHDVLGLYADGDHTRLVTIEPGPGVTITSTGSALHLFIADTSCGDNTGALTVRVDGAEVIVDAVHCVETGDAGDFEPPLEGGSYGLSVEGSTTLGPDLHVRHARVVAGQSIAWGVTVSSGHTHAFRATATPLRALMFSLSSCEDEDGSLFAHLRRY